MTTDTGFGISDVCRPKVSDVPINGLGTSENSVSSQRPYLQDFSSRMDPFATSSNDHSLPTDERAREALSQWTNLICVNLFERLREADRTDMKSEFDPDEVIRDAVYETLISFYCLLSGEERERLYAAKNVHAIMSRVPDGWEPQLPSAAAAEWARVNMNGLTDTPLGLTETSVQKMAEFMDESRYVFCKNAKRQTPKSP